jgi:hypothetical protein
MSWNLPESRIHEDKLEDLDVDRAHEIRTQWHVVYNPTTQKQTYVNPDAVRALRSALVATLPFQPETELERKVKN